MHEAMQSPNHMAVSGPTSKRKRVAAPLGKINKRLMILTLCASILVGILSIEEMGSTRGKVLVLERRVFELQRLVFVFSHPAYHDVTSTNC